MPLIDPRLMDEEMSLNLDNLLATQKCNMRIPSGIYQVNSKTYTLNCSLVREKINGEKIIKVTHKYSFAEGKYAEVFDVYGSLRKQNNQWIYTEDQKSESTIIKFFHSSQTSFKSIRSEERRLTMFAPELAGHAMFFKNRGALIMKKAQGIDMARLMDDINSHDLKLSVHQRLLITRNALIALDLTHRHGGVHRDIKLANLVVNLNDFSVTIIDFAFACADGKQHKKRCGKGTPNHAPPEVLEYKMEDRVIRQSGDVYSLGTALMIFFGYRFRNFFTWPELLDSLAKRAHDENLDGLFHRIPSLNEGVRVRLKALLLELTRYEPEKRIRLGDAIAEMNDIIELEQQSRQSRLCNLL